MRKLYGLLSHFLIFCLAISSFVRPTSAQTGTVSCLSTDRQYNYCRVDTGNHVRLVRQTSASPCDQNRSWGYDARGIWVDRGCSGEFEYGKSGESHAGRNTAIAAGVIGALIVGAVVASKAGNKNEGGSEDSQQRQYYSDGYRLGQKDYEEGGAANVSIWSNARKVPDKYENIFDEGYDDGYNNRRRRY